MPKAESSSGPPPGLVWTRHAVRPKRGVDLTHAKLASALADGKIKFTREELDALEIEGLEWKSVVAVQMGSETKYYAPVRPPRPDHPVLVVFVGIFVLLSIYGFFWMCWKMGLHSYEFFSELDVRSPYGAATTAGGALFFTVALYFCFYPEGQLASDAVAQRGDGRVTFAYGIKDRH